MFEIVLLVCTFVNDYSVDLACEEQKITAPTCGNAELTGEARELLYHPTENPRGEVFIKGVECSKVVPVAPKTGPGEKNV